MRSGIKVVVLGFSILYALGPLCASKLLRFSAKKIELNPGILAGRIVNTAGNRIDIRLLVGDTFNPRMSSNDIRFDLASVSCYFDPIEFENKLVLPSNPLLNSAILNSSATEREVRELLTGLTTALLQSSSIVRKISSGRLQGVEGDQITPYVWPVSSMSTMSQQGVKYIAAMPLFDPLTFAEGVAPKTVRNRLEQNLRVAVRRLISYSISEHAPSIRTIAFAALGSTFSSDSDLFLSFRSGYSAILGGISDSSFTGPLDTVYLVGFHKHEGVGRKEMMSALKSISERFVLQRIFGDRRPKIVDVLMSILLASLILLNYQGIRYIWREKNRVILVSAVVTITAFFGSVPLKVAEAAFVDGLSENAIQLSHLLYLGSATLLIAAVFVFTKRIRKIRFRSKAA